MVRKVFRFLFAWLIVDKFVEAAFEIAYMFYVSIHQKYNGAVLSICAFYSFMTQSVLSR